ncbi:hypothetical protein RUESEDTHA_04143 [Ruegeria sp. THAF57]|uniref:hypothetical protein n=1 Tax=Ruegeria sp. THAF57 TaxID=2744555 RepID=UPI0015DDD040|nr:hypothetical protein [Ruegeria sp. THAF57]CAD0187231.1 hypothetical protein RUESEDTHA_04143 [Ruegeria sp. THAF57]
MRSLIAIQEGQITLDQIKELEAMLRQHYAQHIGPHKLTVLWNVAATHHTITDREWSRSSNVTMEVPDGLPEDQRQHFLETLDRSWRKVTGQHPDQTSFGAFDQSRYREIFKANFERFSAYGRISFLTKTLTRAMLSKARHGVMITQFNQ